MKITIRTRELGRILLFGGLGVLVDRMFILDIMAGIAMTSVTIGLILFNSERG